VTLAPATRQHLHRNPWPGIMQTIGATAAFVNQYYQKITIRIQEQRRGANGPISRDGAVSHETLTFRILGRVL